MLYYPDALQKRLTRSLSYCHIARSWPTRFRCTCTDIQLSTVPVLIRFRAENYHTRRLPTLPAFTVWSYRNHLYQENYICSLTRIYTPVLNTTMLYPSRIIYTKIRSPSELHTTVLVGSLHGMAIRLEGRQRNFLRCGGYPLSLLAWAVIISYRSYAKGLMRILHLFLNLVVALVRYLFYCI